MSKGPSFRVSRQPVDPIDGLVTSCLAYITVQPSGLHFPQRSTSCINLEHIGVVKTHRDGRTALETNPCAQAGDPNANIEEDHPTNTGLLLKIDASTHLRPLIPGD